MTDAVVLPFISPPPHVHRDRWGRPIIQTGDVYVDGKVKATLCSDCNKKVPGVGYRRCTTFIDVLSSRDGLERWKMRGVAKGLAQSPAILTGVAAAINDDKALNKLCQQALDRAGTSDKATYGTAVHAFTEQIDRGETPLVPPHVQADVEAYRQVTAGFKVIDSELFVVNDELRVAGTLDRLLELPSGQRVIGDLKTGSIDYDLGKIAMQLLVYASSKRYDPVTGERTPLEADPHFGLIIHAPAGTGTAEPVWVDLSKAQTGVELAAQIWKWRSLGVNDFRTAEPSVDLVGLVSLAGDLDTLNGVYFQNAGQWTPEAQAAAERRKSELLMAAEQYAVPMQYIAGTAVPGD